MNMVTDVQLTYTIHVDTSFRNPWLGLLPLRFTAFRAIGNFKDEEWSVRKTRKKYEKV